MCFFQKKRKKIYTLKIVSYKSYVVYVLAHDVIVIFTLRSALCWFLPSAAYLYSRPDCPVIIFWHQNDRVWIWKEGRPAAAADVFSALTLTAIIIIVCPWYWSPTPPPRRAVQRSTWPPARHIVLLQFSCIIAAGNSYVFDQANWPIVTLAPSVDTS